MKTNYFFSIAIAVALLINCKGKDGAPGPTGKDGTTNSAPTITEQSFFIKEGFLKGALTTTVEGKPETYNFDFQGNDPGDRSYYSILDGRTEIVLYKSYIGDGDAFV